MGWINIPPYFVPSGHSGAKRTVSLPLDKKNRYIARMQELFGKNFVSVALHREVRGKLQQATRPTPD
jgi:hypothetical protein